MFPPALSLVALVATVVISAGILVFGRLELDPASARLAAFGLVVLAAVTAAGLTVARARWAQRLGWLVATAAGALVSSSRPLDGWWWAGITLAAAAIVALAAPPVPAWLASIERRVPIPSAAIVLMLSLLAVPLVVALAHPSDLPAIALIAAVGGLLLAWTYSQALIWALWAIRFGTPLFVVAWAWEAPWWGWSAVGVVGAVILAAAWQPGALLAAQPLEPRKVEARPILAELAPEDVRRVAGVDEKGRRR